MLLIDLEKKKEKRRRIRALILSLFIPGAGQFFRKRIAAGLFFFVTFSFLIWLLTEIWHINYGIIGTFAGFFLLYIINIVDAYKGPARSNAPCERRCPAGINIPHYIAQVREGNYDDALITILDRMPLVSVCGRVCDRPCELSCALRCSGGSLAIECIKRIAAEYGTLPTLQGMKPDTDNNSIGIIGSGPAGLSTAYFLIRKGYPVTIYEKEEEPGGLLLWGIPQFRLPREVVKKEIEFLRNLGIVFDCGITVGKDKTFDELLNAHKSVLIACGSQQTKQLDIQGTELQGIYYALDALRSINHGNQVTLSGNVAIIGGGNTAFDAARTAVRSGAEKVTIYYRRNEEEIPGNKEELAMALREGVTIEYYVSAVRFAGKKKVSGVELVRTELRMRKEGRRSDVISLEGTNFTIDCDTVLIATGQQQDFSFLPREIQDKLVRDSCIKVNTQTMETLVPGIFAAGDITGGRRSVVDAVGMGRRAASGIDWYIRRAGKLQKIMERLSDFDYPLPSSLPRRKAIKGKRGEQKLLELNMAVTSFLEVEKGFSKEEAKKEASRCLQCNRLT